MQHVSNFKLSGTRLDAAALAALFTRLPVVLEQEAGLDDAARAELVEEVLQMVYGDVTALLERGFEESDTIKGDECAAVAWGLVRCKMGESAVRKL